MLLNIKEEEKGWGGEGMGEEGGEGERKRRGEEETERLGEGKGTGGKGREGRG